ncbi:MAG: hypothetical protein LBT80_06565 [Lactobacillaceae bacterium]|nr:hypothetical protein [Lactobacillaceae bacterium]
MNKISRLDFIALIRKKIFYIPLLLIVIIIGGFYAGQYTSSSTRSVAGLLTDNISFNDKQIKEIKKSGKAIPAWLSKEQKLMKRIQVSFDKHEWSQVAKDRITLIDIDAAYAKKYHITAKEDPGLIYFQRQKLILQFVKSHNVYPNINNSALSGLNFTLDTLNILFPELFVVIIIFMVVGNLTKKYQNKKNVNLLFPLKSNVMDNSKLITSFTAAIVVYFVIIASTLLIGTIFNGLGHFQYPIIFETAKSIKSIPIWIVLLKTMSLQILGIFAVLLLAQIFSGIFKNTVLTIMITVLVTVFQSVAPIVFTSFYSIMHIIPEMYLTGGFVVNNHIATITNNHAITYDQGVLVSIIWIFVLLSIRMSQQKIEKKTSQHLLINDNE